MCHFFKKGNVYRFFYLTESKSDADTIVPFGVSIRRPSIVKKFLDQVFFYIYISYKLSLVLSSPYSTGWCFRSTSSLNVESELLASDLRGPGNNIGKCFWSKFARRAISKSLLVQFNFYLKS